MSFAPFGMIFLSKEWERIEDETNQRRMQKEWNESHFQQNSYKLSNGTSTNAPKLCFRDVLSIWNDSILSASASDNDYKDSARSLIDWKYNSRNYLEILRAIPTKSIKNSDTIMLINQLSTLMKDLQRHQVSMDDKPQSRDELCLPFITSKIDAMTTEL